MIKVTTPEKISEKERELISSGVTVDELIDRVSASLTPYITGKTAIFAGAGNNGSDVLGVAINLLDKKIPFDVYVLDGEPNEYNQKRRDFLVNKGVKMRSANDFTCDYEIILDGMFGIGLNRALDEKTTELIEKINACSAKKISVDVPSGLNASTGEPMGVAVKADVTLAVGAIKSGELFGTAKNYTGAITVLDVGICAEPIAFVLEEGDVKLPKRLPASHKGNYGRISVIGGSDYMVGAPLMSYESAVAASKCGAGIVRLCVSEAEKQTYKSRVKEQTLCFLPEKNGFIAFSAEKLDEIMKSSDVIALGMGMGNAPDLPKIIAYLCAHFCGTLILDADGLNALSRDLKVVENHNCKLVLTPHVGEFCRLLPDVKPHDVEKIKIFARENNLVMVLKSANTLITDGNEAFVNVTGTPALAKGGSGDVLAGMIAAFCAVLPPCYAAAKACEEFGKAALRAEKRLNSEVSVLASDVIIEIE